MVAPQWSHGQCPTVTIEAGNPFPCVTLPKNLSAALRRRGNWACKPAVPNVSWLHAPVRRLQCIAAHDTVGQAPDVGNAE